MFGRSDTFPLGEQIALIIPAFFQENHVPFLKDILPSRLDEPFGYDNLQIELQAGDSQRATAAANTNRARSRPMLGLCSLILRASTGASAYGGWDSNPHVPKDNAF
jgi:hypothetical protein